MEKRKVVTVMLTAYLAGLATWPLVGITLFFAAMRAESKQMDAAEDRLKRNVELLNKCLKASEDAS